MYNKKIFIISIQAIIWLHILSFITYIIYPTPASIYKDANTWLTGLTLYHNNIQNIFYIYFFICLILAGIIFIKKNNNMIKWFFLFLGLLTFWYGYGATRGYTWYFYININRTNKLILISSLLLIISFLLYNWQIKKVRR